LPKIYLGPDPGKETLFKHALQSLKENASPDDNIEENLNVPEEDWARENTFTPTKVIKALESSAVISPVQNLIKSSRA
jgi:hypothetical protein